MADIIQVSLRGSRRDFFLNSRSIVLQLRDKIIVQTDVGETLGTVFLKDQTLVQLKRPGNVTYFSRTAGREEIAGFAPVPGHDWVVGVSDSRDYFAAPINRLFHNVLWSVIVVGALFVLIAV